MVNKFFFYQFGSKADLMELRIVRCLTISVFTILKIFVSWKKTKSCTENPNNPLKYLIYYWLVVIKARPPDFEKFDISHIAVPAENNDIKAYGVRIPG